MNQDQFQELLLNQLSKLDDRMSALETRIDDKTSALDKKVDDRMSTLEARIDDKISALDKKVDDKISAVDDRLDAIGKETAWIRGKLEARGEFITDIKSWIAIAVAIAAIIFAWFK